MTEHQRHILIFRHCLRSTKSSVDQLAEGKKLLEKFYPIVPDWNTPEEWCTVGGVEVLQRTGNWLKERYNIPRGKTRIISDTSQRDIDSALALLKGLGDSSSQAIFELDPGMFHPSKKKSGRSCPKVDKEVLVHQIQPRLDEISPPSSIQEALRRWQNYILYSSNSTDTIITLNTSSLHLQGPVNLIKRFAEMVLYSRASSITTFDNDTRLLQSQNLLAQWIAWERTILCAYNSKAAQIGAAVVHWILTQEKHDDPSILTLLLGHDTTLNGLQTVLDLNWTLPFYGDHSPTPPGSALHITVDKYHHPKQGGRVKVEFLYPTYFDSSNNPVINTSGILSSIPLASYSSLKEFRGEALKNIALYPGGLECYHRQEEFTVDVFLIKVSKDICVGFGLVLMLVVLVLTGLRFRRPQQTQPLCSYCGTIVTEGPHV